MNKDGHHENGCHPEPLTGRVRNDWFFTHALHTLSLHKITFSASISSEWQSVFCQFHFKTSHQMLQKYFPAFDSMKQKCFPYPANGKESLHLLTHYAHR